MLKPIKLNNVSVIEEKDNFKNLQKKFLLDLLNSKEEEVIESYYELMQSAINLMNMRGIGYSEIAKGEEEHFENNRFKKKEYDLGLKRGDYILYNDKFCKVVRIGEFYIFAIAEDTKEVGIYEHIEEEPITIPLYADFRKLPF